MSPAGYSWDEIYSFEAVAKAYLCNLLIFALSAEFIEMNRCSKTGGVLVLNQFFF